MSVILGSHFLPLTLGEVAQSAGEGCFACLAVEFVEAIKVSRLLRVMLGGYHLIAFAIHRLPFEEDMAS